MTQWFFPAVVMLCWIQSPNCSSTPDFEATLNQDGSWAIHGDLEQARRTAHEHDYDAYMRCVLDGLAENKAIRFNNGFDNTIPMDADEMARVIGNDPVLQGCGAPTPSETS